jgi:hypothetical protein
MNRYVPVALASLALGGCATLTIDESSVPTEIAYQTLNAADFAQTVTGARNPTRYEEVAWPTNKVIGHHPSPAGAEAFGAAWGLGHYLVTGWLDREADATGQPAWQVARWAWNLGTLFATGQNVVRNHKIGLTLFGGREPAPIPRRQPGYRPIEPGPLQP